MSLSIGGRTYSSRLGMDYREHIALSPSVYNSYYDDSRIDNLYFSLEQMREKVGDTIANNAIKFLSKIESVVRRNPMSLKDVCKIYYCRDMRKKLEDEYRFFNLEETLEELNLIETMYPEFNDYVVTAREYLSEDELDMRNVLTACFQLAMKVEMSKYDFSQYKDVDEDVLKEIISNICWEIHWETLNKLY